METAAKPAARSEIQGRHVAVTGRLASMTRSQVVEFIRGAGGHYDVQVGADTAFLVVGQEGWPLRKDGRLTKNLEEAERRVAEGASLEILGESEFLAQSQLGDGGESLRRMYTTEQLSRILGIAHSEIRSWIRLGIVQPIQTVRRLCYLDFSQVAAAKALVELRKSGVGAERVRASLAQLGRWLPEAERSVAQLGLMEEAGRLVVRLEDGRRVEPGGQLHLDFESSVPGRDFERAEEFALPPDPSARKMPGLSDRWYEAGLRLEEAGEHAEAARSYHRALLAGEAHPEVCFNLGNVYYALGRADAAAQRYMQAVELDSEYVDAWNNLGNVLCELGDWEEAVEAYERAVSLNPDYAEAHFNFGECLHQIGEWERARSHWQIYLRQDPDSMWAIRVKTLLEETKD